MTKPDTWMPLYIGEYLADTMEFTTELHGAYILLLMHYWRKGPIPDDDTKLAAIAKLPAARWKTARETLGQLPYFSILDGFWRQKRADHELAKAAGLTGKRSSAGTAGASARWGKRDDKPMASAMANASQNDGPLPSPSPLPSEAFPPNPPQAGGADASQGDGGKRPSRADGTNPRSTAKAREEARQREEAAAFAEARRAKWSPRLAEYRDTGLWQTAWGSEPWTGNSGCLVPPDMREAFTAIWRARQDAFALPDNLRRADQPVDEAAAIDAHYREITARRTA